MLFSGSAFAMYEDGYVRRRDEPDVLVHLFCRRAASNHETAVLSGILRRMRLRLGVCLRPSFTAIAAFYFREQGFRLYRLGNIVLGSHFHACHGIGYVSIAGHYYGIGVVTCFVDPVQKFRSVIVGKPHVGQYDVESFGFHDRFRIGDVCRRFYVIALFCKPCLQHDGKCGIVFYYEDLLHFFRFLTGSI